MNIGLADPTLARALVEAVEPAGRPPEETPTQYGPQLDQELPHLQEQARPPAATENNRCTRTGADHK
jgi:hypothetical protein